MIIFVLLAIFIGLTFFGVFVWNYSIAPALNLNEISISQGFAVSLFFTVLNLPEIIQSIKDNL